MGFLDKAKETITKATETAKDKLDDVKDKIDDVKDRRKAEDLFEELGRIVYRQRTGRGAPADDDDVVRLVAELRALEAEGTPVLGEPADDTGGHPLPPADGPSDGPAPA